jgi:hypothetical protein
MLQVSEKSVGECCMYGGENQKELRYDESLTVVGGILDLQKKN